ncbi:MAG: methylenetetrahydrofolate reductase [Nitrososphaera sp.]|jgi:5,10-methylenetetrahydrofolate reductase
MKISYELNPPKIVKGERFDLAQLNADIEAMVDRASQLSGLVSDIHLTDSVLGIPRISSVTAARYIKDHVDAKMSCSIRVRDRNFTSLSQVVCDAILTGVDSLLLLMGDEPADRSGDSGLRPSTAVKMLKKEHYDVSIKLDLSFPAKIKDKSSPSIQNKLQARPHSLVTQSISSLSDLGEIVDLTKPLGIRVAAVVMVPSEKNRQSASIIGLDWSAYEKNPVDFVRQAARIADKVLLTSPNSFASGLELLKQLK